MCVRTRANAYYGATDETPRNARILFASDLVRLSTRVPYDRGNRFENNAKPDNIVARYETLVYVRGNVTCFRIRQCFCLAVVDGEHVCTRNRFNSKQWRT